jgi:hypothetical protein
MHPVYNSASKQCECEWIPGLEPSAPVAERAVPLPIPTLVHACPGNIKCISEQHPVWNATSQRCECEWIDGFGPVTAKVKRDAESQVTPTPTIGEYDPLGCYNLKIYCEGGDHHMHYDPKSKECKCPPVKPKPTGVDLGCENLLIYCEFGNHRMHFDESCKCCKCPAEPSSYASRPF